MDEIVALFGNRRHPLKPKSAYEVICERYQLKVSYSTFKQFFRKYCTPALTKQISCHIQTRPGDFLQQSQTTTIYELCHQQMDFREIFKNFLNLLFG